MVTNEELLEAHDKARAHLLSTWPGGGFDVEFYKHKATEARAAVLDRMTDGWQPIATAPRGGTSMLLWSPAWEWSWGTQIGHFADGEWHTGEGSAKDNDPDFDPEAEVDDDYDPEEDTNLGPTHWHALPHAPFAP